MTAAEHDALLITLLAGLTAGTGYAAGRLHQWYRTGVERDEAYRDGYDTATRSVFSLAARLIGPRRSASGNATATPTSAQPRASVTPPPAGLAPSPLAADAAGERSPLDAVAKRAADERSLLGAVPAGGHAPPVVRGPGAAATLPGSGTEAAAEDEQDSGRHYVPDALVQAETYRLPADRVARAKVRGPLRADVEPRETAAPPSVPRPRSR
jgi:hypothetical protein